MDTNHIPADMSRPSAWQRELLSADRPETVVNTVKDYLVLWTPKELAALPEGCVSERFSEPEDVKQYALKFTIEPPTLGRGEAAARRAVGAFLAAAANRLSELEQAAH